MKIYKFKCKDCGSRKYDKIDEHTYRCMYCGYTEEVYFDEEKPKKEQYSVNQVEGDNKREKKPEEFEKEYYEHKMKVQEQRRDFSRRFITFFLCLFGGIIGIHKFYQRKIFLGVIYLFTMGLCFVGYTYDIIKTAFSLYDSSVELNVLHNAGKIKFGSGVDDDE